MSNLKKIAICGVHGIGKTKIYQQVQEKTLNNNIAFIPEQFREVIKNVPKLTQQTEEITLATYAKQLYLENLYIAQGKNILCDRGALDTFVYYDYFNKENSKRKIFDDIFYVGANPMDNYPEEIIVNQLLASFVSAYSTVSNYSKIYLIEPSDRAIEGDNFRMTDKKEQLEIHKLFLKDFKDFNNVIIVNQEKQDEVVKMIVNDFSI